MSSISFRKPEFRLHLGYPDIVLTASGRILGRAGTEARDFRAALERMAGAVNRARGRLLVILPDTEVWRGRFDLAGRNRAERRASARSIVAGRLGASPDDVTLVLGSRDAGGSFPVAGVRRSTLFETRALLAAVGLRPSAIIGGGLFPGFATAPRLGGGWTWTLPTLPPERRGLGAAVGAGAIVSLAIVVLGLPATQPAPPPVPITAPVTVAAEAALLPPATAVADPAPPPSLALGAAEPPKPRPAAARLKPVVTVAARNMPKDLPLQAAKPRPAPVPHLQRLAELTTAPIRALDAVSAPLRRPAVKPAPPAPAADVTEIARTAMPVLPAPTVASELRPMRRPRAAAPAPVAAEAPKPAAAAEGAALPPPPRAQARPSQTAVLVASLEPAPFAEASLAAAAVATVATALDAPPPARPATPKPARAAAKPVAKSVAKAAPVVVRPKPVEVQQLVNKATPRRQAPAAASIPPRKTLVAVAPKPQAIAPQPAPVRQKVVGKPFAKRQTLVVAALPKAAAPAAPVRQKVVAKPVPVKKVSVKAVKAKSAPVRKAAKDAWAPEPVTARPPALGKKPAKAKPAAQRVGLSRGNISLVGVFAGANGRTALVRLPNGSIEKVKAGDRVQGVQIAAINADSVQVSGRGRNTLLRLPD